MKRRAITIICGIFIGAGLLSGCAKTPESSIVKQKGTASLGNYEEGETLKTGEEGGTDDNEGGNGENSADGQTGSGEDGAGESEQMEAGTGSDEGDVDERLSENALRTRLGAPTSYQNTGTDETGRLQILTDAVVEIPDAEKVSAISVSQHTFDQEVMDRITEVFFEDATIYTDVSYYEMTKADYQQQIEELKGYVAEGNLDPYDWGTDENGNYYYDIYSAIESAEQAYETAPESKTPQEVRPQFGLELDDGQGGTYVQDDYFGGVAVTPDGTEYSYIMKSYSSMPMDVQIRRIRKELGDDATHGWIEYANLIGSNSGMPNEDEIKEAAGITLEEAKAMADEKVEMLNLESMEMTEWEYGVCYGGNSFTRENWADTGYILHYERKLNNMPITYTTSFGGSLEDMDSEMETWGYEVLDITVTKDGIDTVVFCNQYDIGEVKTENLNLLSFDEIMAIYEKMMLIQNADIINYESARTYNIDRITFGYSRIYEPSSDSTTGLLVPVWDFFGSFESTAEYDGEQYDYNNTTKYQSYLTINAIDGSVIDRELGY